MRLAYSVLYVLTSLIGLCLCADQDVLTILKQQDGIALFTTYLELFPDIIDQLNGGTFTILIPTDDALDAFAAKNPDVASARDEVQALIEYHISYETHPSALFGVAPLFPRTLLTNPLYTNVTGGQRVEMMLENGIPTILSGLKAQSHILTPDVFYLGGLIHVIDSVLTIPISFPATITGAGLNDFVALLNAGGWLKPDSIAVQIANSASDLTVFGPNDPRFGATFTGFDALSDEALSDIFRYSAIQGTVVYSGLFKNNTQYKTLQGKSVTITEANGGFYVDQARITTRDYLCSNGVLQVVNQPLNPDTSGSGPIIISDAPPKSSKGGLSSAAAAGVGITLGVLLLGGGIVTALIIRNRKKGLGTVKLREGSPPDQRGAARQVTRDTVELAVHGAPPQYGAHELDNKTPDERSDTVQRHQIGSTVVELRQSPSPTPDHGRNNTRSTRSTRSNTNINRSKSDSQAARESIASAGEHSLNLKAPPGGGLPPSPPNTGGGLKPPPVPAEIDGQERSRISIRISGEAPRHLGFQARY